MEIAGPDGICRCGKKGIWMRGYNHPDAVYQHNDGSQFTQACNKDHNQILDELSKEIEVHYPNDTAKIKEIITEAYKLGCQKGVSGCEK